MAKVCIEIIHALRNTARKIENNKNYQWGHMGACNCGFLAQEVTRFSKAEIHQKAMAGVGDWNEQLNDYCPTSGLPMDDIITELLNFGFDVDDLKHLEKLSDGRILDFLPPGKRNLIHNLNRDVVTYFRAWADLLETELLTQLKVVLPDTLFGGDEASPNYEPFPEYAVTNHI